MKQKVCRFQKEKFLQHKNSHAGKKKMLSMLNAANNEKKLTYIFYFNGVK